MLEFLAFVLLLFQLKIVVYLLVKVLGDLFQGTPQQPIVPLIVDAARYPF